MNILLLAAFLFLSVVPTVAEVVNSVADCNQYLLEEKPPELPGILKDGNILDQNRYKPICQTFENLRRFLTLYDINNKIPVFSAYKYIGIKDKGRPKGYWKIEPMVCFSFSTFLTLTVNEMSHKVYFLLQEVTQ